MLCTIIIKYGYQIYNVTSHIIRMVEGDKVKYMGFRDMFLFGRQNVSNKINDNYQYKQRN